MKTFEEDNLRLEGRNAVLEALKSERDIDKILIQQGNVEGSIKKIIAEAKNRGIVVQTVAKSKLDELSETKKHQGVIAFASAHKYAEVDDILKKAEEKGEKPFIIILDGITDPHNLGAIVRTANISGAHGVIIPKRRSAGLSAVVAKASAGAIEYVPIAKVTNIARTIEDLKEKGIWIACADMDGEPMYQTDLKGAIALVIGNEGEGVSRIVKEKCDFTVKIPMYGQITSLNASVAAGILMYEVVRQKYFV
ncbi:MAG: rRNA (guanosine2251-2-O)-methyltransferase [Epulopiscium sp.]|jgi:23S rRNA (guanosine2251-2'-O)-methyltransferase|uniref:23S rRNA (Guanosine(2251)-2'-O)-methyltransferase RlmB n=1 Tax=Defluviitalea raffinosedens TaxID=1450156 RepID=A0A7C8LDH3_9FIRM|nr:23S rRNA (guanosine(2251)-2'-O)-methyltransferase RlmB [Defluviitalea raffinosedens]MBZ4667535.1 putative TrmH family tRNA/rRNA methyltransferase [Defluviitaleaceae bacterium]MDK2788133.1 rRNA (guanosine2251-2-O)-methyltransferase [Candidatus Epulonipiscium sp.]KAE9631335.1 23S rRNA (guanosine(2251)-2'-O)-methyltransferase RlmB [Defluviitalea raffinosedens]MBM7684898.1 23S rRNA (guanosine2251-2'-O)-methyltransferase [Defluviitalea raffinosedens]HHW67130.1 23S rRNA (guanosine(2251)-2'-O)-met